MPARTFRGESFARWNTEVEVFTRKFDFRMITKRPLVLVPTFCALIVTLLVVSGPVMGNFSWFNFQLMTVLWLTVVLMNLVESFTGIAYNEPRGNTARKLVEGDETLISAYALRKNNLVVCKAGDLIPADGIVIQGFANVDESAMTGESVSAIRESGKDRNRVIAGTRVLTGRIVVRVTKRPTDGVLDRVASLIQSPSRGLSGDEISMAMPMWFVIISFSLFFISIPFLPSSAGRTPSAFSGEMGLLPAFISLWLCLVPVTVGRSMDSSETSEMNRLIRKEIFPPNVSVLEKAGEIDTLIADKTIDSSAIERISPSRTLVETDPGKRLLHILQGKALGQFVGVVGSASNNGAAFAQADIGFSVQLNGHPDSNLKSVVKIGEDYSNLTEVVQSGRRLSAVKRALTTFGIASIVAGSIILVPAAIALLRHVGMQGPEIGPLNFLKLGSPQSAILGALVFNLFEYPLLLHVTSERSSRLSLNGGIILNPKFAGVVGLIAPIIGIKILDVLINAL